MRGWLAREVEGELVGTREGVPGRPVRFVYWVWRDPWMAAGHDTYISRLLGEAGWRNVVPRDRGRYPKVDPVEVAALAVEAMLFPSEPFEFELPRDLDPFSAAPVLDGSRWRLGGGTVALVVDGQLLSWYPSLTAEGLRCARHLREGLSG